MHENLARIEIIQDELKKAFLKREEISRHLKSLGFDYVTLDLEGFRSGSMDEPHIREKEWEEEEVEKNEEKESKIIEKNLMIAKTNYEKI